MQILRVELKSTYLKCRSNVYKYKLEPMATAVVELMTRSRWEHLVGGSRGSPAEVAGMAVRLVACV